MSNFVIFKQLNGEVYAVLKNSILWIDFDTEKTQINIVSNISSSFETKKQIQKKEQEFFLKNVIKAIDNGFVDFTDDSLYNFSFENNHQIENVGANGKYIDNDLKAEYKKEFDFYYQKMIDFVEVNKNLAFSAFLPKLSSFLATVLDESEFNETPFELREKFFDYLTDKFVL